MLVTVLAGTKRFLYTIRYIDSILETSIHKKHPTRGLCFKRERCFKRSRSFEDWRQRIPNDADWAPLRALPTPWKLSPRHCSLPQASHFLDKAISRWSSAHGQPLYP